MVYHEQPPYELLQNKLLSFEEMQRMRRFARFWDLIGNSGNFLATTPLIWSGEASPFSAFMRLTDWLHARLGRKHGIPLAELAELLFRFLTEERTLPAGETAAAIWQDYSRAGRSDRPEFLRPHLTEFGAAQISKERREIPKRQQRHLARLG